MKARVTKTRNLATLLVPFQDEALDHLQCLSDCPIQVMKIERFVRPRSHASSKSKSAPNPAFAPINASTFFAEAVMVEVPSRGLDCRVYYTPPKFANGTVMVCHHGAGYSGLSFACVAKEIADMTQGECGVLSIDARRHGELLTHFLACT